LVFCTKKNLANMTVGFVLMTGFKKRNFKM
jgi:hypothetical protein